MARLSFLRVAVAASVGLAFGSFSSLSKAGIQTNQDWFQDQPPQPPASGPATGIGGVNAGGRDFGGANGPAVQAPPPRVVPQQNVGAQSDFPDDHVRDWVTAYARMARSRAMLHRAENDLDRAFRDARFNFEQSREFREAVAAEKEAYEAFTAERSRALKSVVDDPKYVAALELRDKMEQQIDHLRAESRRNKIAPPKDMLITMASQKLQFATDARNIESAALDKSDKLKNLRRRLVEANGRVTQLRADFDSSLRNNSEIAQARRSVEDMRVAVITAEAYFDASSVAASLATDFSYYRHRWDGQVGPQFAGWGPGWGY